MTLAQSDDYCNQPEPTESTSVRDLRDEIARGDRIIEGVRRAQDVLPPNQIAARVNTIQRRQDRLRAAMKRQRDNLSALYGLPLESEEAVREALTKTNRLRQIFVGTADESEVNGLVVQLERILADMGTWESSAVSVERLDELLRQQVEHQLQALKAFLDEKEIDPAWDIEAIYRALVAERVQSAYRRSTEWIRPRLTLADQIGYLDQPRCIALERELSAAPAYLSEPDRAQIEQLLASVRRRLAQLEVLERNTKVADWQRRYLDLANIEHLNRHETEQCLQELRRPPCELRPEEQAALVPIINRLTAHLDQLSMDELFARIERLSEPQQRELLARLSAVLEGRLAMAVKP